MEDWQEFEYYCIQRHLELYDTHIAWHQSVIPEDELYKAGFIHDFNKTRLLRLAKQREEKGLMRYGDYGMDFLAYDEETKLYHAGQSKYYKEKTLTANDLGTFFCVMRRTRNHGYLYTLDTTKLTCDLRDDIANDLEFIKHIKLPDFKSSIVSIESSIINETEYELRPYQIEAINAIKGEGRKSIEICCGLGKTVIAGHVLKESTYKIVICIAPLRVSVDQLMSRIRPFLPSHYKHLLVDSDSGGTTDVDTIKNTLEKEEYLVIYSTFKSAQDILDDLLIGDEDEYLIVDEVHNALNMELFVNKFDNVLLMSATIQQELYEVFDDVDCVYKYGIADAIKNGYICDYQVSLPYITDDKNEEISVNNLDKEMDAKVEFLVTGMLKTGSRRCIVYLRNCAECEPFMDKLQKHFLDFHGIDRVWYDKIDNGVSSSERKRILKDFQNDKSYDFYIITSVRILDEAIDIPKCDSEFITCVGDSTSDIRTVQRLQRGGRLDKDNITKKNNLFIWCEDWSNAINALSLLKESDIDFHKKIRIMNGIYDDGSNKEKEKLVDEKTMELQKYMMVKCLSIEEKWELKYNLLIEFIGEHHKLPKKNDTYNGVNISGWCQEQKTTYKNGIMSNERKLKLEQIPLWLWREQQLRKPRKWEDTFKVVQNFFEVHKRMPKKIERFDDVMIGNFCQLQKNYYNNGKLSNERIAKIEKLENWRWGDKQLTKPFTFQESFEALNNFVKLYSRLPQQKDKYNDYSVGQFCCTQRLIYNSGKMSDERKNKFMEINIWKWKIYPDDLWNSNFQLLHDFIKDNKRMPKDKEVYNGVQLYSWCCVQRINYKNNIMDDEHKQKIEIIQNLEKTGNQSFWIK